MDDKLAIKLEGLVKNYGKVQALRGVDLEVRRGEIFGFLGPNGAGKTTTIRCMLDQIRPQEGTVRVMGLDPQADPVAVQAQVGYLPGELNLDPNMRVKQALRYFVDLRGNHIEWDHVRELAARIELDLDLRIKNLSKGNKQKVGVVQALMSRPKLLLMDEPTSGLDPLVQQEVYRMLREAKEDGATIFFSSHIISEVEAIAERVAIIRQGVIVEEADPSTIRNMAIRRVQLRYKETVDSSPLANVEGVSLLSANEGLHATLQVEGDMDGLIKALCDYPVSDLMTEYPSLEEIFLAYYEAGEKEVE